MNGLDDLRDVSPSAPLPVYLSEVCYKRTAAAYEYLVKGAPVAGLFIACLDWRIVRPFEPFEVEGLLVTPLPVEHGEPGPMLAFEFRATVPGASGVRVTPVPDDSSAAGAAGAAATATSTTPAVASTPVAPAAAATAPVSCVGAAAGGSSAMTSATPSRATLAGDRVVYISDIAALPLDTRQYLLSGPPIDLLFLDALSYRPYPTHFSIGQALACAMDLKARRTVLVGMGHRVNHYREAPKLAAWAAEYGLPVEFAYDGWSTAVRLDAPTERRDILHSLVAANETAAADWCAGRVTLATTADAAAAASAAAKSAAPAAPASSVGGAGSSSAMPGVPDSAVFAAPTSMPSPPPDAAVPGAGGAAGGACAPMRGLRPQRLTTLDAEIDAEAQRLDTCTCGKCTLTSGSSSGSSGSNGSTSAASAAGGTAASDGDACCSATATPATSAAGAVVSAGSISGSATDAADAAAAAPCPRAEGGFQGWVRPARLPSLLPLVTAPNGEVPHISFRNALKPEVDGDGKCVAHGWPLPRGRPPAVTYLDVHLPGWATEEDSPSFNSRAGELKPAAVVRITGVAGLHDSGATVVSAAAPADAVAAGAAAGAGVGSSK